MVYLKRIVGLLNGHKSQIALAFYVIQDQIIPIWFPDGMPDTFEKGLLTLAVILTAIGLGHATAKAVKR